MKYMAYNIAFMSFYTYTKVDAKMSQMRTDPSTQLELLNRQVPTSKSCCSDLLIVTTGGMYSVYSPAGEHYSHDTPLSVLCGHYGCTLRAAYAVTIELPVQVTVLPQPISQNARTHPCSA